jgi:hypothetical protein
MKEASNLKSNEAEFSRKGEKGAVVLVMPNDRDLFRPLLDGSLSVAQAREIVEERRRQEEKERRELAREKYFVNIREALENEF